MSVKAPHSVGDRPPMPWAEAVDLVPAAERGRFRRRTSRISRPGHCSRLTTAGLDEFFDVFPQPALQISDLSLQLADQDPQPGVVVDPVTLRRDTT